MPQTPATGASQAAANPAAGTTSAAASADDKSNTPEPAMSTGVNGPGESPVKVKEPGKKTIRGVRLTYNQNTDAGQEWPGGNFQVCCGNEIAHAASFDEAIKQLEERLDAKAVDVKDDEPAKEN